MDTDITHGGSIESIISQNSFESIVKFSLENILFDFFEDLHSVLKKIVKWSDDVSVLRFL